MRHKTPFGRLAGSRAEYRPEHYRFLRAHTGAAPEPSEPVYGWGVELLRLSGVALLMAVLWAFCLVLS